MQSPQDARFPAAVRELHGTMHLQNRSEAILISTRGFTAGARITARDAGIELWDVGTLVRLQFEGETTDDDATRVAGYFQ